MLFVLSRIYLFYCIFILCIFVGPITQDQGPFFSKVLGPNPGPFPLVSTQKTAAICRPNPQAKGGPTPVFLLVRWLSCMASVWLAVSCDIAQLSTSGSHPFHVRLPCGPIHFLACNRWPGYSVRRPQLVCNSSYESSPSYAPAHLVSAIAEPCNLFPSNDCQLACIVLMHQEALHDQLSNNQPPSRSKLFIDLQDSSWPLLSLSHHLQVDTTCQLNLERHLCTLPVWLFHEKTLMWTSPRTLLFWRCKAPLRCHQLEPATLSIHPHLPAFEWPLLQLASLIDSQRALF